MVESYGRRASDKRFQRNKGLDDKDVSVEKKLLNYESLPPFGYKNLILWQIGRYSNKVKEAVLSDNNSKMELIPKYRQNRPEDDYDCSYYGVILRTLFDPPLNENAIWRYYDKCEVHCLTLEACNIYMLADRKYPLSKDACQVMLKMKLLDGKMNKVCYKLLKMIEKQAGVRN
ncbi:hypothetical protein Tco_0795431 [Tanacetum coccineum]